jgi:hypothetical protein
MGSYITAHYNNHYAVDRHQISTATTKFIVGFEFERLLSESTLR